MYVCSYILTQAHTQIHMCLCTHSLTPHRHTPGTDGKHVLTKRTDREVGKESSTPLGCVLRISFTSRREKESLSCAEPLTPPESGLGLQGSLAGTKWNMYEQHTVAGRAQNPGFLLSTRPRANTAVKDSGWDRLTFCLTLGSATLKKN